MLCRINGSELSGKGIQIDEAISIAKELEEAGADAIHVSGYNIPVKGLERFVKVPALAVPGKKEPPGTFVPLASEIKKNLAIPVIAVGKINTLDLAEEIVSLGRSDLVAIGRPLIADPFYIFRTLAGEEANKCMYCLHCLKSIRKGGIECRVNRNLY